MSIRYERNWGGQEWQEYAHLLVQLRHGPQNVQRVPDTVQGDAGLEFFTTDGCFFQCYAPEETADTAKSSSGMKRKASRDLKKLKDNEKILTTLLQNMKFSRWFLLCPFLDDKAVVAHVRNEGIAIAGHKLPYLADDFEALVHSQEDFEIQIAELRDKSIGPTLILPEPTPEAILHEESTDLADRLLRKLVHAYPTYSEERLKTLRSNHVKSHIKRGNTLDALRHAYPLLWEAAWKTIDSEETRLTVLGTSGDAPRQVLSDSLDRIEKGLEKDLPTLAHNARLNISTGTLSDWLMRCPLDFSDDEPA